MIWKIASVALFLVLAPLFLLAYQSPVTFFEGDIKASRLNEGFQKITEWTTKNKYDIDTLRIDFDSLDAAVAAYIDTFGSEIDTLHARIDSNDTQIGALETARDSVFFAYNANVFNVTASSTERVSLPTEMIEAGIYWHSDSSAVACNSAGYYSVDFALSFDKPTTATASASLQTYSSGWSAIAGTGVYVEGADRRSLAGCALVQLTSGDSLALAVTNGAPGDALPIIASSARMRIIKLH